MAVQDWLQVLYGLFRPTSHGGMDGGARQVGAIPYTLVDGRAVYLIITSRRTGRWIFPKGDPMEDREPWEAAAQEAFEEAGIRGTIDQQPIGSYVTVKTSDLRRRVLTVDLYPLHMTEQLEDWPEKGQRQRHWVTLADARRLLSDARLAELVEALDKRTAQESEYDLKSKA